MNDAKEMLILNYFSELGQIDLGKLQTELGGQMPCQAFSQALLQLVDCGDEIELITDIVSSGSAANFNLLEWLLSNDDECGDVESLTLIFDVQPRTIKALQKAVIQENLYLLIMICEDHSVDVSLPPVLFLLKQEQSFPQVDLINSA